MSLRLHFLATRGCGSHVSRGERPHVNWLKVHAEIMYSGYIHHETFSFMMSLPAMSLKLRFCVSRKGRTWGGGWVHPKGANRMAVSGLVFEVTWLAPGGPFLPFLVQPYLVGPPFPEFKACFSATASGHFLLDITRHLLTGGCGHIC